MRVYSKTWTSNASFHNFNSIDRMDFDAIFQQINLNLSRKLYVLTFGIQNLETKTPPPEFFACLFDPPWTFGTLSGNGEIFLPRREGASSGFGPWGGMQLLLEHRDLSKGLFIWARLTELARLPRSRHTSKSFVKTLMGSYERAGWLGYRDLGFSNQDLGKRVGNFAIWTLHPGYREENNEAWNSLIW